MSDATPRQMIRRAFLSWGLAAAILSAGFGCAPPPPDAALSAPIIDPQRALTDLAGDNMEGRGVDTQGLNRAADYIARSFQSLHLETAPGQKDYFQRFDMAWSTAVDPQTTLSYAGQSVKLNAQFIPWASTGEKSFSGKIVFVGYGVSSPEHQYDDFAGVDVQGKVVLMLRYEPHDAQGRSRFDPGKKDFSPAAALTEKVKNAEQHGAAAVLLVNPPNFHGNDDKLMSFSGRMGSQGSALPVVQIKQNIADDLLQRGWLQDLKTLQATIDESGKPASSEVNDVTISGKVVLDRTVKAVKNVLAVLPGQGAHADEYIVVGAHYDHLGRGLRPLAHRATTMPATAPSTQRQIYNGADDNASGVTAMLAIADRMAHGKAPARSILFVAFTAEEIGLIGSEHFVNHPPVLLEKMVAMLNLDMVGRLRNEKLLVGGNGTAPSFKSILETADARSPIKIASIGDSGIGPSDHTSFALKKIPVLFFFTGVHADYHRPTDDADKINYPGLNEVIDLATEVTTQLTNMPKEAYVSSADRDSEKIPGMGTPGARVTLGVVPDYASDVNSGGVTISGTVPDSPAAQAGLKEGDTIVGFNQMTIDSLMDLSNALANAVPDEKVTLKVLRDGKPIQLQAALRAKP